MSAPRLRLVEIDLFEREMPFLHPFRFGDVTVRSAPQAFVRVTAEVEGAETVQGATAEMMMPRWFDRDPAKSPAETVEDLRTSLREARRRYLASGEASTAFGHHARAAAGGDDSLPALVRNYGPAVLDKAILDALFKAMRVGTTEGMRRNLPGLDARLTPDLEDGEIGRFLAAVDPAPAVALRWTVGLLDDPVELAAELAKSPIAYLKIKLSGDPEGDIERLRILSQVMAGTGREISASLDANEQYDQTRLARLTNALEANPTLARLNTRLLYLEQPFARDVTLERTIKVPPTLPVIIDEADDSYDAFPRAVTHGYRGVSSKSCKGLYKAILNAVRATAGNQKRPGRLFVTGEDLTCQAGLAVQQDTALAAILGIAHVERNGHHYVDGFGPAPASEAARFARAHPDFYHESGGKYRLDTRNGCLPTASLMDTPGFASGAAPAWDSLTPLIQTHSPEMEIL